MTEMNKKNIEYTYTVIENRQLTAKTWLMRLAGPAGVIEAPGQFVNIAVDGKYLRRPISICDYEADGEITLLYDVVGDGTEIMSRWQAGREVSLLAPLGNGFDCSASGDSPLLIGGGIGIAPLYKLAKMLIAEGKRPVVVLGFNSAREVVWVDEFRATGAETHVATVSGEVGTKGFVTDVEACRDAAHGYFYSCGPMPMLRALCNVMAVDGELSLDERMACGVGVCMCCSLATTDGARRICKDGPVFKKSELIWK